MQILIFKEYIKIKTLVCFASSLFNLLSSSIFINCITMYNTLWIVLQNVIHVPPCFNHVSVIFSQSNFNFHLMSITIFLSHSRWYISVVLGILKQNFTLVNCHQNGYSSSHIYKKVVTIKNCITNKAPRDGSGQTVGSLPNYIYLYHTTS